jgi:2-oxoglutarate dehydrogenase E2 component (dihydrolipoamide succinyltransferase)
MSVDIKIPTLGESIKEARILRWIKQDGDYVKADEPVLEIETDKASDSMPAPAAGIVRVVVAADQVVPVGTVVGKIEPGSAPPATTAPESKSAAATSSATAREAILSPAARRIVEEKGLDPTAIAGTGRDGRVTKEDVLTATKEVLPPSTPSRPFPNSRETRERMSNIRQRIAERLVQSKQSTATLSTFNEADMSAINELRGRYKDRFKEKHGVSLGFMSFFVKAAVEALKTFPTVNARIDGADVVYQNFYDIGVAVSTERGLMVPILRDADQLMFAQIEKKIVELAGLARAGKISTSHLQGGTFTITNGGIFGSMLSTPILNPPQCAILGMHAIQKRPVVVNDQIVIRPMMYLALSYDHRLIDGREAVQFLVRIKECLEDPERMLLEI